MTKKSKDFDVRACVVRKLLSEGIPRGDIRHELPLTTQSRYWDRADVVAFINGSICGYEIKSASDITDRAAEQMEVYHECFDIGTLVGDKCHFHALRALSWSAVIYHHDKARLEFNVGSKIYANFSTQINGLSRSNKTNTAGMVRMLKEDEAYAICDKLQLQKENKYSNFRAIREHASLSMLRPLVIDAIRARPLSKHETSFWHKFDALKNERAAA